MSFLKTHCLALIALVLFQPLLIVSAQESNCTPDNVFSKALAGGKHALIVGKIKAVYADRKDIPGRHIRIRFDGTTLQLAGFVPSAEVAKDAEEIAVRIAKPEKKQVLWRIDASVANREPYKTHVGEQSDDALIKTRVLASLAAPDVRPQFRNAEIQHVEVNHGQVLIYIIADAPPAQFDLAPHITPIEGVKDLSCNILKAFHESDVHN